MSPTAFLPIFLAKCGHDPGCPFARCLCLWPIRPSADRCPNATCLPHSPCRMCLGRPFMHLGLRAIFQALLSKLLAVQGKLFLQWAQFCLGEQGPVCLAYLICIRSVYPLHPSFCSCLWLLSKFTFYFFHILFTFFCLKFLSFIMSCHTLDLVLLNVILM